VRGRLCPRTDRTDLERELQPELHHAAASRTDKRISGRDVGRGAPAAERTGFAQVTAQKAGVRLTERIGDIGLIENVKDLPTELGAEALLPPELLEHGEIHILEA
jgi:hypothetical protein